MLRRVTKDPSMTFLTLLKASNANAKKIGYRPPQTMLARAGKSIMCASSVHSVISLMPRKDANSALEVLSRGLVTCGTQGALATVTVHAPAA